MTLLGSSSTTGGLTVLLTGAGESIQVNGPLAGSSIVLTAKDGGISQLNSSATITGVSSVVLTAGTGSVSVVGDVSATDKGTGLVSLTGSTAITDSGLNFIAADNINLKSTGSKIDCGHSGCSTQIPRSVSGEVNVHRFSGLIYSEQSSNS